MRIGQDSERGAPISIVVDGEPVACFTGESIAAAMIAAGITRFGRGRGGAPRGPYCNMGSCGECYVRVDGRRRRACLVAAADGLRVAADG